MQLTTALAVHDTTEFRFSGEGREGLGYLNKGGRGFLGHFCIGVSADGRRDPLGLLGVESWARTKPTATQRRNRKEVSQSQLRQLERESARWGRLVDEVEDTVDGSVSLIHVMDSEADDYALLSQLVCDERRFVIRLCTDRRLALQDDGDAKKLKQRPRTSVTRRVRSGWRSWRSAARPSRCGVLAAARATSRKRCRST